MGKIGNSAGNAAAQFAETEMRLRYPALPEIPPGSPMPGIGHHFEYPPEMGANKLMEWRVALPGVLMGSLIGGLLAFGGGGAELLSAAGSHFFQGPALTAATVGAGSLMGASFAINRNLFYTLFNYTDNLLMGRLTGPTKEQIARDRARYKMQDPANPYPITWPQRFDEYQRLLNGYYKKSFEAGWAGDRRGYLGGIIAGSLSGLLAGGVACAGLALTVGTGGAAAPFFPLILSLCTALGARQGTHIFADAGREPASFSVVREIHTERVKALNTPPHQDISFDEAEARASHRVTHHPDMDPPGTDPKTWFNWKIALVGLAAGAILGVAIAPMAGMLLAHLGVIAHGTSAVMASTTLFGLSGMTFAMGDKTMNSIYKFSDKIFMGTFFPGHSAQDHVSHEYPPLGPDSALYHAHQHNPEKHLSREALPEETAHAQEPKTLPPAIQNILAQQQNKPKAPPLKAESFVARGNANTNAPPSLAGVSP
jgi:hypothetical protein